MEPPIRSIRAEKVKLLPRSDPDPARRYQFRARPISRRQDWRAETAPIAGKSREPGSNTETYVAAKLNIDNWRWAGVPFYLRTGKALAVKRTEIAIKFKQAPFAMFRDTPVDRLSQNYLIISTEPTEGIGCSSTPRCRGRTSTSMASR